jgi:serine/threonine-protein kinase
MPRSSCANSWDDGSLVDDGSPFDADRYVAGDRVSDKYRLEMPLGFGAMGMLWRAHNEALDAPVALKLIRRDARWSWSAERLLREARVMASFGHPAIVRVFDYGMTNRRDPFIVMELLQGETLRDLLDRETTLSAVEATRLLLPILEGLDCVHARGIVHRDLKPENIFLSRGDRGRVQPKLLDFGIARCQGSSSRLTTGGVLLGSPSYMSPEQAEGEERLDGRVDVWAAAVVLYEMIAGREPWDGRNCPALLHAIVHDDPASIKGIGGVDPPFWSILELGLAKKRDDRWSSCRDFGWALASWLAARSIVDDVTGTSLANRWLAEPPARASSSGAVVSKRDLEDLPPAAASARRTAQTLRATRLRILSAFAAIAFLVFLGFRNREPDAANVVAPPVNVAAPPPETAVSILPSPRAPAPTLPLDTVAPPEPTAVPVRSRPRAPAERAKPAASTAVATPAVRAPTPPPPSRSAQDMDFGF